MKSMARKTSISFAGLTLIAGVLAAGTGLALAGETKVTLSGTQEVPPVQTSASGSGTITINDDKSVSGSVTISGASRITSAKSLSGDVSITDTQTDGSIEASSVSGSISLSRARARGADLGSISGDVVVHDVECDRADLHSFSGNVEYAGSFTKNGRYDMKSHSGDVRLAVAGSTGFEVEATTFSGSVRSDLQLQRMEAERASDRMRRRSIRGTYGDGSAVVQITTFSGSVVLGKR